MGQEPVILHAHLRWTLSPGQRLWGDDEGERVSGKETSVCFSCFLGRPDDEKEIGTQHRVGQHIVTELSLYFHVHKRDLLHACKGATTNRLPVLSSRVVGHRELHMLAIWGRITVSSQFSENKGGARGRPGKLQVVYSTQMRCTNVGRQRQGPAALPYVCKQGQPGPRG